MRKARAGPGRRCHLILSVDVWRALTREAARQGLRPSHVAEGLLAGALDVRPAVSGADERKECSRESPRKHRMIRAAVDVETWEHLAERAARRRLSIPQLVREELLRTAAGGNGAGGTAQIGTSHTESDPSVTDEEGKLMPVIEF